MKDALVFRIYEPRDTHRERIPMCSLSIVFIADVRAVLKCAELLLSKHVKNMYLL